MTENTLKMRTYYIEIESEISGTIDSAIEGLQRLKAQYSGDTVITSYECWLELERLETQQEADDRIKRASESEAERAMKSVWPYGAFYVSMSNHDR